jgi:methyltransferase-like protein
MTPDHFDAETFQRIDEMSSSVIDLEQYMDFVRNRTFRQTLLCQEEAEISRTLDPRRLSGMYVASHARPKEPIHDPGAAEVVQFEGSDGAILSTDHPVSKAAMLCLEAAWPRALAFDDLLQAAQGRVGGTPTAGERDRDLLVLGVNLLKAYSYSSTLVKLHTCPPKPASIASQKPYASKLARHQAASSALVTNLRHERVQLKPLDRHVIRGLDGKRDRAALIQRMLAGPVSEGRVLLEREGVPVEDPSERMRMLAQDVDQRLDWLVKAALLES